MSLMQGRGGWPHVHRRQYSTAGDKHDFKMWSAYLQIRCATNPCKVYFTEKDFNDDVNYIEVPIAAATHPWGYEGPAEVAGVWIKGDGGDSDVELIAYQRRA